MTDTQFIILVIALALAVMATRFLPFLLFGKLKEMPPVLDYLSKVLPAATMGLLVVYCYKDLSFASVSSAAPGLIAGAIVVLLHLWKRNTILSISVGTVLYMVLLRIM